MKHMTAPKIETASKVFEATQDRLVSLDAFRGMTMAFMVLVNTPGTGKYVYPPLQHAKWDGWTPTDVVFPSFVWIVGVAMTLSFAKRLDKGASKRDLFLQACKRAAIIFLLGLFSYSFPKFDPDTFRILGVLQRIAICYVITAAIYLTSSLRAQIIWTGALLASFWLIMMLAPVPGYGSGNLDMEHNFAHYVDRIVLGTHNYHNTKTWDPEGIISTLPSIATCLFGVLAGHLLKLRRDLSVRTTWFFLIGNALIFVALVCDHWLPINKSIWTSSFALFMAGLDFVIFGAMLWLVDGLGYKRWARPFVILGMNAIAIYMASELVDIVLSSIPVGATTLRVWLYETLFAPLASGNNASLMYAIAYVLSMYLIAWLLYRRKWFLRV